MTDQAGRSQRHLATLYADSRITEARRRRDYY